MILPGKNLIRVAKLIKKEWLIYMVFTITVQDLNGDQYSFQYKVPFGKEPASILRDLASHYVSQEWFTADLEDKGNFLSFKSIRKPDISQDQIQAIAYAAKYN